MAYTLSSEGKNLADQISKQILDYDENLNFSRNIIQLYKKVSKKIDPNTKDPAQAAINLFFVNIYNSFDSFLILIERKKMADSFIIARRIVEIYIRNEYLCKNDRYLDYYRMKYFEKAIILRTLIKSHRTRDISRNPLWQEREIIVKQNKELYEAIHISKTTSAMPSVEGMASDANLSFLYYNFYSTWSKMVHCNMSTEALVRYNIDKHLQYDFPENNLMDNKKEGIKNAIACTNHIMYQFICTLSKKMNISRNIIDKFKKNNIIFTSYDLYTGRQSTTNQIVSTFVKNSFGIEDSFEDMDEVKIFETDANIFKRNNEELGELVRATEEKLLSESEK